MYKTFFYVPAIEDYYYSLIYHGLIHKGCVKEEYICRLESMAYKMKKNFCVEKIRDEMEEYMRNHNYAKTDYRSL